jgi:DNA-binding NtrC family response regulator
MPIVRDIQLPPLPIDLPQFLAAIEEAYIAEALAAVGNSRKEAAALLGINRTTFVMKMRRAEGQTTRRNTGRGGYKCPS